MTRKNKSCHTRTSHILHMIESCPTYDVYRKASDGVSYHHMLVALERVRDRELVQGMRTRTGCSGPWGTYTP